MFINSWDVKVICIWNVDFKVSTISTHTHTHTYTLRVLSVLLSFTLSFGFIYPKPTTTTTKRRKLSVVWSFCLCFCLCLCFALLLVIKVAQRKLDELWSWPKHVYILHGILYILHICYIYDIIALDCIWFCCLWLFSCGNVMGDRCARSSLQNKASCRLQIPCRLIGNCVLYLSSLFSCIAIQQMLI